MIRLNAATSEQHDPNYDKLLLELQRARMSYVTVGFHSDAGTYEDGSDVFSVAMGNEFGDVKEYQGKQIVIPERSFLRSAIDEHMAEIDQWREEGLTNVIEKGWTTRKALESLGFKVQTLIQNKILSNIPPPNSPEVRRRKLEEGKALRTLVDTRLMLRSVTFKVVIQQ